MSRREQQVYVVSVEVQPLEGSVMSGRAGGFAYCYALATDARDAADRVAKALREDHYALLAVEWIRPSSDVAWDEADEDEQHEYAAQAQRSGDVVYSAFDMYEAGDMPD